MNYPNGIKKSQNKINTLSDNDKNINYKNRGMTLEKMLNDTNKYYCDTLKAFVYKKPTPIKLVKVNYKEKRIDEAYFDKPSTTDYNGLYEGKYIDFEAKETNNLNDFPIANIHAHQLAYMRNIMNAKGICFLIVRWVKLNRVYLLMTKDLFAYLDNVKSSKIPLTYFEEKGYLIKEKFIPCLDYLEIIDKIGGLYEK